MRRIGVCLLLLCGLLLTSLSHVYAQTITISPTNPSVTLGKTVQFAAKVTVLTNTEVTWYAGGVKGGNAKAGTISTTGLYTAPSVMPAQNPVQITATSKAKSSLSASTYVNLLDPGPTITSVSPNPIAVGNLTVTIQGTGFKTGATVFDSYGSNFVALSTTSVTSTTVVATGYQGNAATATFSVKNPGSDYSNSITVPVTGGSPPPGAYSLTVVNGSGSGSYNAGTVVTITANAPPAGGAFLNWTGATVANPNAATTTLTMPAANTTVTANFTSPPQVIPYPVSSHPRLWVTTNDLPRLQSWATSTNPIYAQGMAPLLAQAVNVYNTQFFPNGVVNPNYPDPGDVQGYTGYLTEQYAAILAFNSLIDPSPANRILYAQYARNMLMVAMNQAVQGHLSGAPFRDPLFAVYNRANGSGEQWPLIVDWIYNAQDALGNPILTASDKATIRNVFLIWANDCINASTTGGDHPAPIGATNNLQLLPNNLPYRMAANNYYLGHARLLTMMALCMDPGDDPAVNAAAPASQLGNTLRSYILNANGAWLYQEFAMFGDPSTVATAYGLPGTGAGFGLASGGLPPEGMLYGHSYSFILGQLLALQTAGFNDPKYSGPQIQLIGAPMWDRFVTGFLSSLTPTAKTFAEQPWLGPVYQYGSYGDLLRLWVTPDFMQPFALLSLLEQENGKTTHFDAARWFVTNATEGGANALLTRITQPFSYSSTSSILYFLLLDPSAATADDPRSNYPTLFYDPAAGRIVAHSDWTANGTMFDYRASWESINHQLGDGGQFELFRKGEWLTKEMSNYDNNTVGLTTTYHNTLALQNWSANGTPSIQWYEQGEWSLGSQWILGLNAGDPTTVSSSGQNYVYAASDLTRLYNRPDFWTPSNGATDITQATRSILWLNNDYIVVYDRATSTHSNLFKRFNLSLVTNPILQNNIATETLTSGQQLYIQTLLPANPTLTATNSAGNLNPIAQLEPTQYILTVEDTSKPTDTRFLHVLQGADSGGAMVAASYLKSTQGTAFDGTAFGNVAVFFPVSASGTFSATLFTVPNSVHTLFLTGLTANTSYGVAIQTAGGNTTILVTPGATGSQTDGAGVLHLTF